MGLYDTFYIDGNCEKCGAIISEWQTKQLERLMLSYKIGDKLEVCGLTISQGSVGVYNCCPKCNAWNTRDVSIKDGIACGFVKELIENDLEEL